MFETDYILFTRQDITQVTNLKSYWNVLTVSEAVEMVKWEKSLNCSVRARVRSFSVRDRTVSKQAGDGTEEMKDI